jgi:hypothetical protein
MSPVSVSPAKPMQTGSFTVTILELTKVVTFGSNLPNTDYSVYFAPVSTLNTSLSASSKTISGFTAVLSVGVAGTINWMAIGN